MLPPSGPTRRRSTCTSCHGMPPTGHVAVAAPITAASCAPCHPTAVNPNGSINLVDKGHLNGLADTSARRVLGVPRRRHPDRQPARDRCQPRLLSPRRVGQREALRHRRAPRPREPHRPRASSWARWRARSATWFRPTPPTPRLRPPRRWSSARSRGPAAPSPPGPAPPRAARRPTATATSRSTASRARGPRRSGRTRPLSPAPRATGCRPPATSRWRLATAASCATCHPDAVNRTAPSTPRRRGTSTASPT